MIKISAARGDRLYQRIYTVYEYVHFDEMRVTPRHDKKTKSAHTHHVPHVVYHASHEVHMLIHRMHWTAGRKWGGAETTLIYDLIVIYKPGTLPNRNQSLLVGSWSCLTAHTPSGETAASAALTPGNAIILVVTNGILSSGTLLRTQELTACLPVGTKVDSRSVASNTLSGMRDNRWRYTPSANL